MSREARLAAREIDGPDLALERQEWEAELRRNPPRVTCPPDYRPEEGDPF